MRAKPHSTVKSYKGLDLIYRNIEDRIAVFDQKSQRLNTSHLLVNGTRHFHNTHWTSGEFHSLQKFYSVTSVGNEPKLHSTQTYTNY